MIRAVALRLRKSGAVRSRFASRLLAVLALVGLIAQPFAVGANATVPDQIIATSDDPSVSMPEGMPCCPETQKKSDCAKVCPFMAACSGITFAATASGVALTAPVTLLAVIAPDDDPKLKGLAQGPPARPPKA
jgi:hypothetical protein